MDADNETSRVEVLDLRSQLAADRAWLRQKGIAKLIYRDTMGALARVDVLGIREEGIRLREFVDKKHWPAIEETLEPGWAARSRDMLDRRIVPCFGDRKLTQICREAIETWYANRCGEVSSTTANKELARFKHLLARAVTWGYVKDDPSRRIRRAKEGPGRIRYLSPVERDLLLNGKDITVTATDGRTWVVRRQPNPALRLYIICALQTGARRSELVRLRWSGVDMRARMITFSKTKNKHAQSAPMTAPLHAALAALPRPLSSEAHVLPEREPKVITRAPLLAS